MPNCEGLRGYKGEALEKGTAKTTVFHNCSKAKEEREECATHGGYVGGGEHQPGESLKDNLAERCKTLSLAASVTQTVECTAEI